MYLSKKIAEFFGEPLGNIHLQCFSDGEFQPNIKVSVRGAHLFCIQSTFPPSDNLMELLLTIDAAKRASADYVTAVIPYFGLGRQDRKDKPRVSIGAKLVANLLTTAGADRIMTMDLHAEQIQGFFDIPVDHLNSSAIFVPYIENLELENLCFATPDVGGTKRVRKYAEYFNAHMVICEKFRKKANEVATMTLIGDVKDKNVVIIDDIVDTANTLKRASEVLMKKGARSVRACCTHPVLSGDAYTTIESSELIEMVVTDTIPVENKSAKITELSVAEIFAEAMENLIERNSISSLFIETRE